MRINKYVALATGLGRRKADKVIQDGAILVNGAVATKGINVSTNDSVFYNGKKLLIPEELTTIMLHKPVGYVCSRNGQGSRTIYDLLPKTLHHLKPVGRLDKDSSVLLLLTNDGTLANQLTHPAFTKTKVYEVTLNSALTKLDWSSIHEQGIVLPDGPSKLFLERLEPFNDKNWQVTMHEGRNRQIRRTFAALGYRVTKLHRTHFDNYKLGILPSGKFQQSN